MSPDAAGTSLMDRLARLAGLSRQSFDELLWYLLLAGLLLSALYLVTMLVTRWGERHASSKAMIFSLLVHLTCVAGLLPLQIDAPGVPVPDPETQASVVIRELDPAETSLEAPQTGNTPVWEKLPDPEQAELARLERHMPELKPPESIRRTPDPFTRPEVDLPDLPTRLDEAPLTPQPELDAQTGPLVQAAIPQQIDNPETLMVPEAAATPPALREREPLARDSAIETGVARSAPSGTIDRTQLEFEPTDRVASLPADLDPRSFLRTGPLDEAVESRRGPTPAPIEARETGQPLADDAEPAGDRVADARRTRAVPSRVPAAREDGVPERLRPRPVPAAPQADLDRELAVRNGEPVDVPPDVLEAPNVVRPDFSADRIATHPSLPPTYRLRGFQNRRDTALKHGGTDRSEQAVEDSLKWLASHQEPAGHWDADRFGAGQVELDAEGRDSRGARPLDGLPGSRADAGLTGLAVLAFLGAGYSHEEGPYAQTISRALNWLIRIQTEDGYLGGEATHYAQMYCHAMATIAVAEAYGMQADPTIDTRLREPLERAVAYLVARQNPDGGWRYRIGTQSDMSMFGWQLMALKSADIAGIRLPSKTEEGMKQFLIARSIGPSNALAAYGAYGDSNQPTPTMTAEALFCKQMLGMRRDHPQSTGAVGYLLEHAPRRSELNLYYWYYGTLAMHQHDFDGPKWRQWFEPLRELLIAEQVRSGENAGSWDPRDMWGQYGGRIYSTALATLCLEAPYRYLPLYQQATRQ